MDLEIVIISEVSQTKKDKYHMILLIGGIFKERVQMNLFTKQSHRCRKQNYGYQGVRWGGINWENGIDIYTLLYIK